MNKRTGLALIIAIFSSHLSAKMTYDDAVNSSKKYYDSLATVDKGPALEGIPDGEMTDNTQANQMGKWVKVSGTVNSASAGEYSVILAPSAVGQTCLAGQKGLIMEKGEVCTSYSSSDRCLSWSDNGMLTTTGIKAECR